MIRSYRLSASPKPALPLPKGQEKVTRQPKPFFNKWRLAFLVVLVLSVVAYLPSLQGLKVWDDNALLDGSGIGGGDSFSDALTKPFLSAYFRPLVSATFFLENRLWHGVPFLYHQTNILFHAATCAALMGLLLLAFGSRRIAALGGLLFALQPTQVSTVAWIGGRTDSLCALLVTLFAYTLLLAIRSSGGARKAWYGLSVVSFFLAAVTKEQILALLPLVPVALMAFGGIRGKEARIASIRWLTPYVLASALFVALWFIYYPNPFHALPRGPVDQAMTAGQAGVYYALLLLAPSGKWMHTLSLGTFQSLGWLFGILGLAVWAGMTFFSASSLRRDPKLGFFALLALFALLPVSNLVPLPSLLVAPYRAGVAGLGVAAVLAVLAVRAGPKWQRLLMPVGGAWLLWCGWLTLWGSTQWKDPVTIFSAITTSDPHSIITRRNLSLDLVSHGRADEGVQQIETILGLLYRSDDWKDPALAYNGFKTDKGLRRRIQENQGNAVEPEAWLGELYAQLATAQNQTGDVPGSKRSLETAIRIDPKNPRVRDFIAQYALYEGKPELAIRHLRVAIAVHPGDPALYDHLAQGYGEIGEIELAKKNYRHSISMQPWFGITYLHLADLQAKNGDPSGAIATLEEAKKCFVQETSVIDERLAALEKRVARAKSPAGIATGRQEA